MNVAARKGQQVLLSVVVLLMVAGLACAQAGEVLTPAEATERAVQALPDLDREGSTAGNFQVGDTAALTGRSFLVNIMDAPGGRISAGQERGAVVTVLQATAVDDFIWYQIQAPGGTGWVRGDALEAIEGEADDEAGSEEAPAAEEEAGGVAAGDTVYLAGTGFLVNLYDEPGGLISATQEQGATVVILDSTTVDGAVWYQIEAPTGQGWVPQENITAEAP